MDYKGKPFGPMPNLLAIAEYVTKVRSMFKSGKMASYTHRIVESDDLILLGDTKKYQALSRKEFINQIQLRRHKLSSIPFHQARNISEKISKHQSYVRWRRLPNAVRSVWVRHHVENFFMFNQFIS